MGRPIAPKIDGFSEEEKMEILKTIHIVYWSVNNYCNQVGMTRQRFYQILNAKKLTPSVKAKLEDLFNE